MNLSKMSKFVFYVVLTILIVFSSTGGSAQTDNGQTEPLAIVNEEIISLDNFYQYWDMVPDEYKMQLSKEDLLDQLVTQTLLLQKADELNLKEDPEIAFQIQSTVEQILIQFLLEKEIVEKTELSDEDIAAYYEQNKENFKRNEQIRIQDILVKTEEEANDILTKLAEGQEFAELAKELSTASSASDGGNVGLVGRGTLLPDIEEKLFILNEGEISEIIPTEQGFHVFKVSEKIPESYLDLDTVKSEIENILLPTKQQEAFDSYLETIENQAIIEKNIDLLVDEVEENQTETIE